MTDSKGLSAPYHPKNDGAWTREDIVPLLSLTGEKDLEKLFEQADRARKKYIGDRVHVRGILEFSNYCKNDCLYCGIRRSNSNVTRYRIEPHEIVEIAENAVNSLGYSTVLLQSGEDDHYTPGMIEEIIRAILERCDCRVALSIGERTLDEYRRFYDAGARRCLVRFETTNKKLYERLHPGSSATKNSFEERMELIKGLKSIGYQCGTGCMIGLPGQTAEDLAEDILFYNRHNINMAGMGPFLCHGDTPLAGNPDGTFEMALKMIAVTRIVCKDIFISATTALQTLKPIGGRELALQAGANLLMPNITPKKYRKLYLLYPNKVCTNESPSDCSSCVTRVIHSANRTVGSGFGDTLRK